MGSRVKAAARVRFTCLLYWRHTHHAITLTLDILYTSMRHMLQERSMIGRTNNFLIVFDDEDSIYISLSRLSNFEIGIWLQTTHAETGKLL